MLRPSPHRSVRTGLSYTAPRASPFAAHPAVALSCGSGKTVCRLSSPSGRSTHCGPTRLYNISGLNHSACILASSVFHGAPHGLPCECRYRPANGRWPGGIRTHWLRITNFMEAWPPFPRFQAYPGTPSALLAPPEPASRPAIKTKLNEIASNLRDHLVHILAYSPDINCDKKENIIQIFLTFWRIEMSV